MIQGRIESPRLYLRQYLPGDGRWYYAMSQRNRNHLARYELDNIVMGVTSAQKAEEIVEDLAELWQMGTHFFMGAFLKASDTFVAQVYAGLIDDDLVQYEIGFFVDVDHQGQGYATEAVRALLGFIFDDLQAHRVQLECDDSNERCQRVAGRCGLVQEGHLRENRLNPDGSISGTMQFGLLKREYELLDWHT